MRLRRRSDAAGKEETYRKQVIEDNKHRIWEEISKLEKKPLHPAKMRRVLITIQEKEYFDHDLDYDEKYTELLVLQQGFIGAHLTKKSDLLGIRNAVILDIAKHRLMCTSTVTGSGLGLLMVSYQGCTCQPQDDMTYFKDMLAQIKSYKDSLIKKILRC